LDSIDAYLEAVKKEPFKDDNVILIEPDINIKEKFEQIDLICNLENRINNSVNAPVKLTSKPLNSKGPQMKKKHYDTDTETEEEKENMEKQEKQEK
jgi:hypothetical protein